MVPEDDRYTGRISPSETAFRGHAELGNGAPGRRDARSIAWLVVELQQPKIQLCFGRSSPTAERGEERIPGLPRHRNMDEFSRPFQEIRDAVHQLD